MINSLAALEHLAYKRRCNLFGDFVDKFEEKAIELYSWKPLFAKITANQVYKSINTRGLVETYQENIQDEQLCVVLATVLDGSNF